MNRIRLLSEQVINQIAAGEVIERPASVVKELLENSLDAGARQVRVAFRAGGRSAISIADDGWGMSRDDALLCLERHGTSKIAAAEDLESVRTLGFRGEAIPSIAAVSRFTLTTREHDAPSGTRIEIAGGKLLNVQEVGAAPGTTVEARSLFFNLPARRKFLRTPQTESAHIHHIVTLHALAHPAVAWRLQDEERAVLDLAPARTLAERIREIYGAEFFQDLVPVGEPQISNLESEIAAAARVSGFVGRPGVSRATREQQHVFVNGRPVESRGINFALLEAYHTALMRGRFPIAFLFVEVPPGAVDVNIHPAKREVRFRNEYAVRAAVTAAVRCALEPQTAAAPVQPVRLTLQPETVDAVPAPVEQRLPLSQSWSVERRTPNVPPANAPAPVPMPEVPDVPRSTHPNSWRVIGVIGQLYVLIESSEGLVLLDQHAAHERVLFERMLKQLEQGVAPSQRLLMPATLELEARDAAFVRENMAVFQQMGIGLSEFGPKAFLVDALPPWLPARVDLRQVFSDVLDEVRAGGASLSKLRLGEDAIATTVCRHAVKAHDPLSVPELDSLLRELRACDLPYTCPHGRPTMIQLSYAELEKKFGRRG
ncbi:MAG: DNA mismatch repair endonuclease MutL [Verrucomicrobia bacterium]|nr:DNA mismatch repair endonuclease MutL [Verrucomicrobiota bacterium]